MKIEVDEKMINDAVTKAVSEHTRQMLFNSNVISLQLGHTVKAGVDDCCLEIREIVGKAIREAIHAPEFRASVAHAAVTEFASKIVGGIASQMVDVGKEAGRIPGFREAILSEVKQRMGVI